MPATASEAQKPLAFVAWRDRRRARKLWEAKLAEESAQAAREKARALALAEYLQEHSSDLEPALASLNRMADARDLVNDFLVVRAFNELLAETTDLRYRPVREAARHLVHYRTMTELVANALYACPVAEQSTMQSELARIGAWLDSLQR